MRYLKYTILLLLSVTCISCLSDILLVEPSLSNEDNIRLSFVCEDIQKYQVGTRSAVDKNSDETHIRSLVIFFFDNNGEFLTLSDVGKNSNVFAIDGTYIEETQTLVTLTHEYFSTGAANAKIYVVANFDSTFVPSEIKSEDDLLGYTYMPQSEATRKINEIPAYGMPMFGYLENVNLSSDDLDLTVRLKALMAKVEFSIGINSANTDASNTYPRMFIQKWTIGNKANGVKLGMNDGEITKFNGTLTKSDYSIQKTVEIQQSGSRHNEVFYLFENRQVAAKTLEEALGFTDEKLTAIERFKVLRADDDATYLQFEGIYHDASRGQSAAELVFYLGSNNYDNFTVKRNSHYNNIITITGLMSDKDKHPKDHVLYDSRVSVSGTEATPYFLSVLREHDQDAHFGVTPIDFYFYRYQDIAAQRLIVEVVNPTTTKWIRMEKVDGTNMEEGTLPSVWTTTHINAGGPWHAGHGKRKYFTTNLVTSTLAQSYQCEITGHRDRVYLYIDENLSTKSRTGSLRITYQIKRTESSAWENSGEIRTIDINQRGLLPVTVTRDGVTQTFYIEQIEEYLDNYDPYDMYNSDQIYPGLPWGASGTRIGANISNWPNVYLTGLQATIAIVSHRQVNGTIRDLNGVPGTAAEYCYNKNKRDANGNVVGIGSVTSPGGGWFLPGITQQEGAMTTYFNLFSSFQTEFYWSSAPAKESYFVVSSRENADRARATRYEPTASNRYVESGSLDNDDNYVPSEGNKSMGGRALRTQPFRIRAAYIPPAGKTIE